MWREANNKFALAIDNIYLRKGGVFMSSPAVSALEEEYVRIDNSSILVACYTPYQAAAIEGFGMDGNLSGVLGGSQGIGKAIWGIAGSSTGYSGYFTGAKLWSEYTISSNGSLKLLEKADDDVDQATYGQFWVKSDNPNVPMFTNGDGTKYTIDITAV